MEGKKTSASWPSAELGCQTLSQQSQTVRAVGGFETKGANTSAAVVAEAVRKEEEAADIVAEAVPEEDEYMFVYIVHMMDLRC